LERLAPEERAAFLLREVFDFEYAEVPRIVRKSPRVIDGTRIRAIWFRL
jgi:RNA polymerase sigma-70 factor, ECF subfamily